jgi:hypothetical protein
MMVITLIFKNIRYPHITKNVLVKSKDETELKAKKRDIKYDMKQDGYKLVRSIATMLLLLISFVCSAQVNANKSLSITVQQDLNNKIGVRYVMEQKGISFDGALTANATEQFATVKLGAQLLESGNSRIMLYPFYFDYKNQKGYRIPSQISLLHTTPNLTYNIGVDMGLKGDWNINAAVSMPIFGSNYKPSKTLRYDFRERKVEGLLVLIFASFIDGAVEGFEFDNRTSFERKGWTKNKYGYFGSLSHAKEKNQLEEIYGVVDFYHTADDIRKFWYIGGGGLYAMGMRENEKVIHHFIDIGIMVLTTSLSKQIGMDWIRN